MARHFAAVVLTVGLFLSGCGIGAALDCQGICSRYKSCFDANYNVQACEERCRSNSAADTTYRAKADSCKTCIDGASCSTALFSCGANCVSVVP